MGRTKKTDNVRGVVPSYEALLEKLPANAKITPAQYKDARNKVIKYFEIMKEKEETEKLLKDLKTQLEKFLENTEGKKYDFQGLGSVQLTAATIVQSYDRKTIDRIKDEALRNGDIATATALANAQVKTPRAGSVRISRI